MAATERTARTSALVALCFLYLIPGISGQGSQLPHVDECNYCLTCHTGDDRLSGTSHRASSRSVKEASTSESSSVIVTSEADPSFTLVEASPYSRIYPTVADIQAKAAKPNCTECRGCTTQLKHLAAVTAFGQDFKVELGASPEWIFTADLPGGGKAIIKVWCFPVDKVHKTFGWRCQKQKLPVQANQFLVAQQKVADDCGLMDVTVRIKLAPVNAVVPGLGLHIWWDGLWMERAEGISINQLSYITRKTFVEDTIMDLLGAKLNTTRVVRAALFDLLTSQCDRHAQNVFINERGQITLIDNLQAMKFNWEKCAADSIFLPGTQKNEIARFGGNMVFKKPRAKMKRSINPMLLLDYRCYVPGGKIGLDYPPELTQCLKKITTMTPEDVMTHYDFPNLRNAQVLSQRAKSMLEHGFEWALQLGDPTNMTPKRYRWHQPCCKLKVSHHAVQCGHEWNVTAEFPKGEPLYGTAWRQSYPDPGTFEGGTVF